VKKDKNHTHLIGKIAVTDTELNPSGTVLIDNEIYDAKTDGEFVEAGRGVRVTRVSGNKIFVKRV
jgi:membrane-bound serine protease (ClpP class)